MGVFIGGGLLIYLLKIKGFKFRVTCLVVGTVRFMETVIGTNYILSRMEI